MSDQITSALPLFEGLIYNELGEPVEVAYVGGVAHYAIPDDGFLRHVIAEDIDQVVLEGIKEQITSVQDEVVRSMLEMMGKDDIFTKAAIDASIRNLDKNIRTVDRDQWIPWLRLMGFRVVVDVHGHVLEIIFPQQAADDDE